MEKTFTNLEEYLNFYGIDQSYLEHYNVEKIVIGKEETVVHVFEPEIVEKTILLIHGYFDHTGGWKNIINHFLAKQCRVVTYDLQGHGLSSGIRGEIEDFEDYVETLKQVLAYCGQHQFTIDTVIAHSTGAAICTNLLLQYNKQFNKVIFLAPLVRPMNWSYILLASKLVPTFTKKLKRKFRKNSKDSDYLDFTRQDPLQCNYISIAWVLALIKWNKKVETLPVSTQEIYIIQGNIDKTVDWKYNISFLKKKFNHCQIAIIEDGRHQLMNDQQLIKYNVLTLIDNYLARN